MTMYMLQTVVAAVAESSDENFGGFMSPQRLEIAGQVVLIGMGMVFAVLALLWGVLAVFGKLMSSRNRKSEPSVAPAAVPAPVSDTIRTPDSVKDCPAEESDELVAVITAAVAAAIQSDEVLSSRFASGFRVVSFKKSGR